MKLGTATASFVFGLAMVVGGAGCGNDRTTMASNNPTTAGQGSADRTADRTAGANVSPADREFMEKAALGGMTEVQLGRLAQEKGASQAIKDYGKTLVDDHTA